MESSHKSPANPPTHRRQLTTTNKTYPIHVGKLRLDSNMAAGKTTMTQDRAPHRSRVFP